MNLWKVSGNIVRRGVNIVVIQGGPQCFTPESAYTYGRFLGERYRNDPNIIWILGGAWQMQHMRTLLFDKYPFYELEPDFDERIIAYGQGKDGTYIPAAVSADRRCFLAYMPESMAFGINLDVLRGPARLRWYDVRTGEFLPAAEELHTGIQHILPPEIPGAPDFVLIAETAD